MRELLEGAEPGHPLTVLPELTLRGTTGPAPA
jgi:LacI family transcriptional regulator